MEFQNCFVFLLIGAVLGGLAVWIFSRQGSENALQKVLTGSEFRCTQLETELSLITQRNVDLFSEIERLNHNLTTAHGQKIGAHALHELQAKRAGDLEESLKVIEAKLEESFRQLSSFAASEAKLATALEYESKHAAEKLQILNDAQQGSLKQLLPFQELLAEAESIIQNIKAIPIFASGKLEQCVQLDEINKIAKALINAGVSPNAIAEEMVREVNQYQSATGNNLIFKHAPATKFSGFQISNSQRVNHFYVAKPNDVRLLQAKIDGVTIQINLYKPGKYDHDNQVVAKSLRHLANLIEDVPIRLADQNTYTWLPSS